LGYRVLDIDLLGNLYCAIDRDAKVPMGALGRTLAANG